MIITVFTCNPNLPGYTSAAPFYDSNAKAWVSLATVMAAINSATSKIESQIIVRS